MIGLDLKMKLMIAKLIINKMHPDRNTKILTQKREESR